MRSEGLHPVKIVGDPFHRRLYINGELVHGVQRVSVDFGEDALSEITITMVTDDVTVSAVEPEPS